MDRTAGVVYKIPFTECFSLYVGETKNLPERLKQHANDVRKLYKEHNAVAEHAETLDHWINFEATAILESDPNWRRRVRHLNSSSQGMGSGIDVNKPNSSEQTALDLVRTFSSSKAARDLKVLLREMLQALPARAIRDHYDPSDSECLMLREGDMVTVLEQCESGRWKGIVFGPGHSSRAGYFPATAVQLLHRQGESSHRSIRALISEEEDSTGIQAAYALLRLAACEFAAAQLSTGSAVARLCGRTCLFLFIASHSALSKRRGTPGLVNPGEPQVNAAVFSVTPWSTTTLCDSVLGWCVWCAGARR
ncbi:hypothetical protein HPB51_019311 [Rhipicephalus microplus]|uniref:SH3 domain-containing protein n=1 Tax=Rhipicephalus microplus TaxID=6941 RepID=A0A9J6EUT9_RHIMP|nr:hypothetical protein HPB51_019311 [Rhipicephalus microplus]